MVVSQYSILNGVNGKTPTVTITTQQGNSNIAPLGEASQVPLDRMVLRRTLPMNKFQGQYVLNNKWAQTPFRIFMNAGDLLSRQSAPGGSNQVKGSIGIGQYRNTLGMVDGVRKGDGASGNQHYVYDSSIYTKYKRLNSKSQNYNDTTNGGSNNGAYSAIMRIRR
jgi:hypothetical protein